MKRSSILSTGLVLCLLFTGCSPAGEQTTAGGGLRVCASFSTMADFAGKIGGDRAEVVNLMPSGAEPHDWEPSARDIAALEGADILVINGAGFEHWVDGVIPTLQNKALVVVDTSEGIGLRGEQEQARDPHVWLDPSNAALQLEAVRAAFAAADPDNAACYNGNYEAVRQKLNELDGEYRDALSALPGRHIVVAHEAYGYLCEAYGLSQVAVQGLSPEGEPDPAQMAEVVNYSRDYRIKIIFFEETASPKVAEAIARETGAETAVLSPLESLGEGQDYFSVMRENLEQLKRALS